jgi:hypothetical protein
MTTATAYIPSGIESMNCPPVGEHSADSHLLVTFHPRAVPSQTETLVDPRNGR